jgi:acyl-CoA reductase-like NAD-dependent aldehyde dehydrogenase/GTP cyclohydrolase II
MKPPGSLTLSTELRSYCPTNEVLLGSIAISSIQEVSATVARSRYASPGWAAALTTRIERVESILSVLKTAADELAQNITREMGKPIHEAHREIEDGFECIRWYLDHAPLELRPIYDRSDAHEVHEIFHVPCGVTAVIVPWNFPFLNVVWSVFPNLIAGNTVILKHSEKTPLFAERLRALIQPELPEGVFELLSGDRDVGRHLCQAEIDQVCFTGSSRAGLEIQRSLLDRAASAGRTIPMHSELGGSAAGIVLEDADVSSTAEAIFRARFENAGQVCDGLKRLLVQRRIQERLVGALTDLLERRPLGDPSVFSTFIGPLVDARQRAEVESQVEDARELGASIRTFGVCPTTGCFYPATLIRDVNSRMRVWREEVFGPVLPIVVFDSLDEAVALSNDTVYGLGGYIYSSDFERIRDLRRRLHTGMVAVGGSHYIRPSVPFTSGGYGLSGTGTFNGPEVFRKFCRVQVTSYSHSVFAEPGTRVAPPPVVRRAQRKRERAQGILAEAGVFQRHIDGTVEVRPYELPIRLGEEVHRFHISLWAFDEGTAEEDAYFVACYGQENFCNGAPLVRIQSLCPHGHYFHSTHCDCDAQRDLAMQLLVKDPIGGVLIMAASEKHAGRGIGQVMIAGLYAYGYTTGRDVVTESFNDLQFNRDERDFTPALEVLRRMGLRSIRLLTNNPEKARYVGQAQGLELQEIVPLIGEVTAGSLKERLLLARAGHYYDRSLLDRATAEVIARDGRHPLAGW